MKLFLPHPVAARWLPVMVIASALIGVPHAHAQAVQSGLSLPQIDAASIQEQGDEMSRRVGGFFRKLFYGEDRNSNYSQPQPQSPYQTAPQQPQPNRYQYAPPPASNNQGATSTTPRKRPPPSEPPATASHKSPSRTAEPDKPKHKEDATTAASHSASKRPGALDSPPLKKEVPDSKPVAKRKNYTPPTVAGDDTPALKPKKEPKPDTKTEPTHKENVVKAPVQDQPPSSHVTKKSEPPTVVKSTPSSHAESGGLSPYADGVGSTTLMAPKDSIASTPPAKPEEPKKKKETTPSAASGASEGTFPTGTVSAARPGTVVSPYPPHNELDVSGLPSGSLAVDPTTKKVFRVP